MAPSDKFNVSLGAIFRAKTVCLAYTMSVTVLYTLRGRSEVNGNTSFDLLFTQETEVTFARPASNVVITPCKMKIVQLNRNKCKEKGCEIIL